MAKGLGAVGEFFGFGGPQAGVDPYYDALAKAQATRLIDKTQTGVDSATAQALKTAQGTNLGNVLAGMASRGGNASLAQRNVLNQGSQMGAETVGKGAMMRLEEQKQNEALLSAHLAQQERARLAVNAANMGQYGQAVQNRNQFITGLGSALAMGGMMA